MPKFKRDGIWYARIKHPDGRWRSKTLNTSDAKVADVRYRERERATVGTPDHPQDTASFVDAVAAFATSRRVKGCAAGTMHMYGIKLAHLVRFFGADRALTTLEPPAGAGLVDEYVDLRLGEGASRNTIGKELTALRGLLKVAKRAGKFRGDLAAVLPNEWATEYEPRRAALTPEQVDQLVKRLARSNVNHAAMVAFTVATGARLGEAARARADQIDLKRRIVYFEITKTKKRGRREKHVPVTRLTRPLLVYVLKVTKGRAGALFDAWQNIRRDLEVACKAVAECPTIRNRAGKLVARVTPNDLRRTHANWLRAAGVDTSTIADVLGHTDSRMVERVYGRERPEQLRDRVLATVH